MTRAHTGPGAAAGAMGRLAAGRVTQALRLEDATSRSRDGGDSPRMSTPARVAEARLALARRQPRIAAAMRRRLAR